ncbi:MAG: hypothetical protein C0503_10010, partial [Gemmatimonas sp.]|nr:hypothetical protein [Gemmatimonas sp.]
SAAYGSFALRFGDQTTAAITYTTDGDALAAAIQSALVALSNIGAGEVAVTQATGSTSSKRIFSITFSGTLGARDVPLLAVRNISAGILVNTRYALTLGSPAVTLTFDLGGETSAVNITAAQSNATIIANLTAGLEALGGVGAGNVLVTGTRAGGFTIEFVGARARTPINGLTVATAYPAVHTSVTSLTSTGTSTNEIQAVIIDATVTGSGVFTLSLGNYTTSTIRFAGSDVTYNARRIREALAALPIIGAGNVTVVFDGASTITHQRYVVTFTNGIAGRNLPTATADNSRLNNATVSIEGVQNGVSATRAAQRVTVVAAETGTFRLSITDNGTTYLTSSLAIGASASEVARALTAAWSPASSGFVEKESDTAYVISFNPSSFEGRNPALIVVTAVATGTPASISRTQVGGSQSPLAGSLSFNVATQTAGAAPVGEIQRLTISQGANGTFTLSIGIGSATYTTAAVSFDATADELVDAVFNALEAAYDTLTITVTEYGERMWDIAFEGDLAGVDIDDLEATLNVAITEASITVVQTAKRIPKAATRLSTSPRRNSK